MQKLSRIEIVKYLNNTIPKLDDAYLQNILYQAKNYIQHDHEKIINEAFNKFNEWREEYKKEFSKSN